MTTVQEDSLPEVRQQAWRADFEPMIFTAPGDWTEERVRDAIEIWLTGGPASKAVKADVALVDSDDSFMFDLQED